MKKVERQNWEQVKRQKDRIRKRGLIHVFYNDRLMKKAEHIAGRLSLYSFVLNVGVFGSTARGEMGKDVDLIIIDDGMISNPALQELPERRMPEGFSSAGAYANICYNILAEHIPGGLNSEFYQYLRERPMAIDLVFVSKKIQASQAYLDTLVLYGNDPFFFRNIMRDTLLFDPKEKKFRIDRSFPGFINGGAPSSEMLWYIRQESSGDLDTFRDLASVLTDKSCIQKKQEAYAVPVQAGGTVRFEAIGGQLQAKSEVVSLSAALKHPERYQRWGTKPPRGICLCGPPGTGKTLLAKALASEAEVPFYPVDASQLISMWYGESEKNLDRTFEAVRKTGGILFFDEADSLASSRSTPNAHEATKRVVAALCRNMDGFKTTDNVVVFFATNRLEDMDPAVLRPGRTDRIIEVPLPDRSGRKDIFEIHVREAERIAKRQLFRDLDIESLLEKTENYSGADIAEIVRRTLEAKVRDEESGGSQDLVSTNDIFREVVLYERVKKNRQAIGFSQE